MVRKTKYKHGHPFSETLAKNIDSLQQRIENKKASLIIIDGGVGEGKTTLGVHISDYINKKDIDFTKQYAMGGLQFEEKLEICYNEKLPVLIYDEAGDFDSRGFLTGFNKRLKRIFETYRGFRIIVVVILPTFQILDPSMFRLKIPRLLLHCEKRTRIQGNFRAYSLYRMLYIKHYLSNKNTVIDNFAFNKVKPNFYGHYLDLPQARSDELERISLAGKKDIVTESILQGKGLISSEQLAVKLNRRIQWVRRKVKELSIEPVKRYKRLPYFNEGVYNILLMELKQR